MKTLLALCILVVSCAHVPTHKVDFDFCGKAHELFDEKIADFCRIMREEESIKNVIISNEKFLCEEGKAYAGWTTVLEGSEGKCVLFNTIISYTDHPTEIVYKLVYSSEGELTECLTSS